MSNSTLKARVAKLQSKVEFYDLILNNIHNGIMITDAEGYITYFNEPYGEFLGMDPAQQIGKHCLEAIENSRMHIVAETGISEINQSHSIQGQNMVVQRIPIRKDGNIIAVFGQVMFKDVSDVGKLANRLNVLESKVALYEQELMNLRSTRYTYDSIVGKSKAIKALKKEALKATTNQFPVLVSGESGTGKELFAQAIHHSSPRKIHPFVRINCAAIPKDLLESELFGYEKGAFTGARRKGKPGKIELANYGTLFLDEIGDLPLDMQPKLLRVLEEKEFERIGGNKVLKSDFRLIAATNQNLKRMMEEKHFRKDLFYRLNVIPIHIPPLRERQSDIMVLVTYFLKQLASEMTLSAIHLSTGAKDLLRKHDWPGNARELSNVLERTVASLEGNTIQRSSLPLYIHRNIDTTVEIKNTNMKDIKARAEKKAIVTALEEAGHNKARAARLLGIHRTLLYKKMKRYTIKGT